MKKLSTSIVSSLAVVALLTSCGKDSKNKSEDTVSTREARQEEELALPSDGSNIDGLYNAKFITLNPQVNGTIPGSVTFYRKNDQLNAYVRLFAGAPKAWHQQFVYEGTRCPDQSDDLNGDGFIDILEAEAVMGKILVPLDSDISSQNSGRRFFPLGDPSGYYHYERVTSFRRFLADLQSEIKDPNSDMTKLGPGKGLQLIGRTVLILGINDDIQLPDTVATKGRFKAFQNFPIACGTFVKVDEVPGNEVESEVPGPIADVMEGQDRPAGEVPESTGGRSTSGTTTGSTNDSDNGDGPVSDGEGRSPGRTTGGSTTGGSTTGGTSTSGGSSSGRTTSGGSTSGGSTQPEPEIPTPDSPTEETQPETNTTSGRIF